MVGAFDEDHEYQHGGRGVKLRLNFVKIETDEKITGYGEAFLGPGLTAAIRDFSTILIGEDPTSFDR